MATPPTIPSDPATVVDALRMAAKAWRERPGDAIDWVRQAAQLAQDAGLDARAIDLAIAAADLAQEMKSSGILPVAHPRDAVTEEHDVSGFAPKRSKDQG